MGIILEDALKYPGFDLKNKKIQIDGDKKKVYIDSDDVSKMFDVYSKSSGIVKAIISPKYNSDLTKLNILNENNCVEVLGENIMFDSALPSDKKFMHDLIKVKHQHPNILNEIPVFKIEQSAVTFDELDEFILSHVIDKNGKVYLNDI